MCPNGAGKEHQKMPPPSETTSLLVKDGGAAGKYELISKKIKIKAILYVTLLIAVNLGLLSLLAIVGRRFPQFTGPGMLSYTFGLRHAVDADHICAIDNVTRKLLNDSQKTRTEPPLLVGLFFSLGHSTVVFLLCAATALGSKMLDEDGGESLKNVGGAIGTTVSGGGGEGRSEGWSEATTKAVYRLPT